MKTKKKKVVPQSQYDSVIRSKKYYLDCNLTLVKLAKHMGTNRSYMSAFVNNVQNMSFTDYINGIRLEKAADLMINDERKLNLDEIAEKCGFKSYSTFSRAFLRKHNCTPSAFRKQCKNAE